MVGVIWLSDARHSLYSIYHWYFKNMGHNAADKFRNNIEKHVQYLTTNPLLGRHDSEIINNHVLFRVLTVAKKHRIIYFVQSETVYIAYIESCKENRE